VREIHRAAVQAEGELQGKEEMAMSGENGTQEATGSTSAEGKRQVSKNARTHGLTAKKWLLLPEERQEFEEFKEGAIGDSARTL